jgi:hypothetical protein
VKVHGVGKDTADLSVSAAVAEFFAGAGPVDILVNCAGGVAGQVGRPLEEVTDVVRWPRSSSVPPPRFAASWRSPCLGLSWVVFCRTAAWIRQVSHRGQVSTGRARQGRPRQVPGQLPDLLSILTIIFGRRAYFPDASYLYSHASALNDITSGNNAPFSDPGCGGDYQCNAGPGYDGSTGNGTPHSLGAL